MRLLGWLDAPAARFLALRSTYFRIIFRLRSKQYLVAVDSEAAEADASDLRELEGVLQRSGAAMACFGIGITAVTIWGGAYGYME